AKAAKPAKKKQPVKTSKAKGLTVLSEVALTKAEQMKLATKRSLIQTHSSHASGSGADEGTGGKPGVPDVPTYELNDEQISWKSNDDNNDDDDQNDDNDDDDDDDDDDGQDHEGQDDDNKQTDSDNDGDDFVHPKFSTHDEEDNEEEGSDLRVQTPSHYESTDDEEIDEVTHGANELYRDVNINLEGRDTEMTDASCTIIQTTQVTEDTHVIITLVNPEDVLVTTIAEPSLSSATTLPPPTIPLITHLQQTLVPTPTTVPSSSLQDFPNFGSLFGFDHRLKTLETDFSEFKQTNQFAAAVSSIPNIVDMYLANKMNEAVKTAVQLQSDRLRNEAQADNEDFINKLDDNIKKIIKEQTPHTVTANLFELELKKILIDKMESNKSIHKSDEQKNLYKALVDAYESDKLILDTYEDKLILDTYGDTVLFKRRQDDEDKDEEPSTGSNRGSKRRRAGKEPESTSAPKEKTSKTIGKSTEGSKSHHESADKSA
ncbi:hypothetical protein Tco_1495675, partial [Tanacetum coccineum]